jgi:hypothetical protein
MKKVLLISLVVALMAVPVLSVAEESVDPMTGGPYLTVVANPQSEFNAMQTPGLKGFDQKEAAVVYVLDKPSDFQAMQSADLKPLFSK